MAVHRTTLNIKHKIHSHTITAKHTHNIQIYTEVHCIQSPQINFKYLTLSHWSRLTADKMTTFKIKLSHTDTNTAFPIFGWRKKKTKNKNPAWHVPWETLENLYNILFWKNPEVQRENKMAEERSVYEREKLTLYTSWGPLSLLGRCPLAAPCFIVVTSQFPTHRLRTFRHQLCRTLTG